MHFATYQHDVLKVTYIHFIQAALKKENTASRQPPEEMVRFLINFIPQLSSLLEALVDKMKVS